MNRDFIIVAVSKVFQILSMIIALRLLTMQLLPEEMGKYAIYMTLIMFFSYLTVNPIAMYVKRFLHEWVDNQLIRSRMLHGFYYLIIVSLGLVLVFLLPWAQIVPKWQVTSFWLIVLVSGTVFFNSINQVLLSYFNMINMRMTWAVFTILTIWTGLLFSWCFTKQGAYAEYWISGQLLGQALFALLALLPFIKNSPSSATGYKMTFNKPQLSKVTQFAVPIGIAVILSWFQFSSYRLLLGQFSTLAFLGFFAAGYAVSSGIMLAYETTLQQYFNPLFYKMISGKDTDTINGVWQQYMNCALPMLLVTTLFIVFLAKPVMTLIVDPKYWAASNFIIIGALVETMRVLGNCYGLAMHARLKTKLLIMPQIIGALLVCIFVPIGLIFYGNESFVPVILFASAIYIAVMHFVTTRAFNVKVKLTHWKKVLLATVLFALIEIINPASMGSIKISLINIAIAGIIYCAINLMILRNTIWMTPMAFQPEQKKTIGGEYEPQSL